MTQPAHVYRRRRAVALAALAGVLVAAFFAIRACGADGGADADSGPDASKPPVAASPRPPPPELPRGGRRIFPDHRVVAFYGAPQDEQLGVLGIGTPTRAARRLERTARSYARKTRPVLPAFELISTIAAAAPGDDGLYRIHQSDKVIRRYLAAARRAKVLLVLDIQPGRADFLREVKRIERWLREPDVGLALDPEWHVGAGQVPGQTLGSVTADKVNEVASYVAAIVDRHELPEKLFVIHQFTHSMIEDKDRVLEPPGLAVTFNVDGFGDRPNKISKYDEFTSQSKRFHDGFKLFYEEDTNLMKPRDVLALGPPPDLVVYE